MQHVGILVETAAPLIPSLPLPCKVHKLAHPAWIHRVWPGLIFDLKQKPWGHWDHQFWDISEARRISFMCKIYCMLVLYRGTCFTIAKLLPPAWRVQDSFIFLALCKPRGGATTDCWTLPGDQQLFVILQLVAAGGASIVNPRWKLDI